MLARKCSFPGVALTLPRARARHRESTARGVPIFTTESQFSADLALALAARGDRPLYVAHLSYIPPFPALALDGRRGRGGGGRGWKSRGGMDRNKWRAVIGVSADSAANSPTCRPLGPARSNDPEKCTTTRRKTRDFRVTPAARRRREFSFSERLFFRIEVAIRSRNR